MAAHTLYDQLLQYVELNDYLVDQAIPGGVVESVSVEELGERFNLGMEEGSVGHPTP